MTARTDQHGTRTGDLPGLRPLVVVTVGSDHHRFDRLVRWVDEWLVGRNGDVDCVVQHGPADPPRLALGVDYLDHAELQRLIAAATVVVAQGGPMSVVEARRLGRLPVVVPRTARFGEVVDDHQHVFSQRMARQGLAILATDSASLSDTLDAALANPSSMTVTADPTHDNAVAATIERFGRVIDGVTNRTPGRGPLVVMLGGFGRSGSTLLERCLGEVPGVTAIGEVLHLWERGLRDDERCGCGAYFSACEYWRGVGMRAFGGWHEVDTEQAIDDRLDVVRNRHLPGLICGFPLAARRLRRDRLLRRLDALYAACATGSRAVIDSSKHPAYAYLLRRASVTLRCVLVVRDPRGVAYSWSKSVDRPEVDGLKQMPTYGVVTSALRWSLYGALFHALSVLRVPVSVVRYEDLVADPKRTVERVLRFAGMETTAADLSHIVADAVVLSPHHTVAGNPMRFQVGEIKLREDREWRLEMSRGRQRAIGLATAALRLAYGYIDGLPRSPRRSREAPKQFGHGDLSDAAATGVQGMHYSTGGHDPRSDEQG